MTLSARKRAVREAAFARRKTAFETHGPGQAGYLSEVLAGYRGVPLAGYMPMRTEISPLAAMAEACAYGPVGVPVIRGAGQALVFSRWEPDCALVEGPFGAQIPAEERLMVPEIVIVPLVAFTRRGDRLGYGGGFYDRTLEGLRKHHATMAIGFAFAAQETDELPMEATDQRLDLIVTDAGIITP
jgi:5-formyltetrahydrofolate cyclo-ligase